MDSGAETSTEASIASDDVIRAGGFGARDDIGCFLPAASDSTDFEASLRDARNYEDPQEGTGSGRPGLGWTEVENKEIKNDDDMKNEDEEPIQLELKAKHIQEEHSMSQLNKVDSISAENVVPGASPVDMNVSVEVSMEASINSDDVIRAGGFGARDDIGCFLPAASDSTDFEASLREARDYEDSQEGTARPGLGWTEVGNKE